MPKTALFVRTYTDWTADARLYRLSEPIKTADGRWFSKVIISVDESLGITAVVIYAANDDGTTATMDPVEVLECACDHEAALKKLGYEMEVL